MQRAVTSALAGPLDYLNSVAIKFVSMIERTHYDRSHASHQYANAHGRVRAREPGRERSGPSFISPEQQRDRIAAWARSRQRDPPELRFWDEDPEPWPIAEKCRMAKPFVKGLTWSAAERRDSKPPWQRLEVTWQGQDVPDEAVMEKVGTLLTSPLAEAVRRSR